MECYWWHLLVIWSNDGLLRGTSVEFGCDRSVWIPVLSYCWFLTTLINFRVLEVCTIRSVFGARGYIQGYNLQLRDTELDFFHSYKNPDSIISLHFKWGFVSCCYVYILQQVIPRNVFLLVEVTEHIFGGKGTKHWASSSVTHIVFTLI